MVLESFWAEGVIRTHRKSGEKKQIQRKIGLKNGMFVFCYGQQVREVPGKLGSGLVVFLWLVGGVPSRGLLTGTPRDGTPPHPPPLLVPTAGKEGCSGAGHRGPIPWCSRCWWLLESGNTTRRDPSFRGTSRACSYGLFRTCDSETGIGGVKTYRTLEGGGNSPRKLPLENLDF